MHPNWTRRSLMATGAAASLTGCASHAATRPVLGGVRRIRPELDALIAPEAQVEELGDGYTWAEGPCWVRGQRFLLFSDVPGDTMYKWTANDGVRPFLHPSGYAGPPTDTIREGGSNGLAYDDGAVIVCDSGNRCVSRLDVLSKRRRVLADRYQGRRFNSPNDAFVHRNGAIYFTDPPYGLAGVENSPLRELPFAGVYRLDTRGNVALVDNTLSFPNGVALSPDQKTLYISVSDPTRPIIKAYDLGDDGMPTASRVFFNAAPLMGPDVKGLPDGMTVDASGNLFASGPGGIMVLTPDATLLGVIQAGPRPIANCEFGEDGKTLFLTAEHKLARIRTLTHG
ncbi:MAG: SMP-30/gluconolactonase/LRE family protein [Alphaproteobacteria bacterium]